MALALSIIGVLVGIPLGLRSNVFALVPTIGLAIMFTLTVGVGRGESFGSIVLAVVTVGMAIKLGYFVGTWNILGRAHPVGSFGTWLHRQIAPTQLAADTAGMVKKPEPPKLFWLTHRSRDGRVGVVVIESRGLSTRASWLRWPAPIAALSSRLGTSLTRKAPSKYRRT